MMSAILVQARSEEAKKIRRMYGDGSGMCKFSHDTFNLRGNHSNALTHVQKDNLLIEIYESI